MGSPLSLVLASPWAYFLLALGVESAYLVLSGQNPYFLYYIPPDQYMYLNSANAILKVNPLGPNPFKAPLYSYLVAAFQAFGVEAGFQLLRAAQAVAAAASVALVFRIGRSIWGPLAGGASALLLLLYWPFTLHAGEMLGETFFILLFLLAFDLILSGNGGAPRVLPGVLAGILLAAGALIRPNAVLVAPVWLALLALAGRGGGWRGILRAAGPFLAGFTLILLLNGMRNAVNSGEFQPLTHQGPVNFVVGNRPGADGITATLPGLAPDWQYEQLAAFTRRATGREMDFREVVEYWQREASALITRHPGAVLANLGRKTLLFANDYEIPNTRALGLMRRTTPLLQALFVGFAVIFALAGVGVAGGPRRDPRFRLLAWTTASFSAGVILIFVCSRYRLPAVPFFALLAGAGVAALARWARERRFAALAGGILLALLLFAASRVEIFGVGDEKFRASEKAEIAEAQKIMRLLAR